MERKQIIKTFPFHNKVANIEFNTCYANRGTNYSLTGFVTIEMFYKDNGVKKWYDEFKSKGHEWIGDPFAIDVANDLHLIIPVKSDKYKALKFGYLRDFDGFRIIYPDDPSSTQFLLCTMGFNFSDLEILT